MFFLKHVLGNYNVADIIANAEIYRSDSDENDVSDIESDKSESGHKDAESTDVNKRDSAEQTLLHLAVLKGMKFRINTPYF